MTKFSWAELPSDEERARWNAQALKRQKQRDNDRRWRNIVRGIAKPISDITAPTHDQAHEGMAKPLNQQSKETAAHQSRTIAEDGPEIQALRASLQSRMEKSALLGTVPSKPNDVSKESEAEEYKQVLLSSANRFKKQKAMTALIKLGGSDIEETLIKVLREDNARAVKVQALQELGKFKSMNTLQIVIAYLLNRGEAEDVRTQAADTLGEIGNNQARYPLIRVAQATDAPVHTRGAAMNALGTLKIAEAVPNLEKILVNKDCNPVVRWYALINLEEIQGMPNKQILQQVAEDTKDSSDKEARELFGDVTRRLKGVGA